MPLPAGRFAAGVRFRYKLFDFVKGKKGYDAPAPPPLRFTSMLKRLIF
jgi:hypothetical protein